MAYSRKLAERLFPEETVKYIWNKSGLDEIFPPSTPLHIKRKIVFTFNHFGAREFLLGIVVDTHFEAFSSIDNIENAEVYSEMLDSIKKGGFPLYGSSSRAAIFLRIIELLYDKEEIDWCVDVGRGDPSTETKSLLSHLKDPKP